MNYKHPYPPELLIQFAEERIKHLSEDSRTLWYYKTLGTQAERESLIAIEKAKIKLIKEMFYD